ncbi:MAG TPA: putative PEP-binding protein, partial [Geobacteraceae bacterium]
IGTNDLIQYTLAADRNNPKVKQYYDSCHPAVLHSIKRVVDAAHQAGIQVSLCGEMAADPLKAIMLLGFGITDFSMSSPAIPLVKQALAKVTGSRAAAIAADVLAMDSATAVRAYLADVRRELSLADS